MLRRCSIVSTSSTAADEPSNDHAFSMAFLSMPTPQGITELSRGSDARDGAVIIRQVWVGCLFIFNQQIVQSAQIEISRYVRDVSVVLTGPMNE
jgi:hypothetical protein